VTSQYISVVYFFYGLAFYSMGLLVAIEGGRSSDLRLRRALRPLAAFGLIHGIHEWLEMFSLGGVSFGDPAIYGGLRLAILSFSFLSLAAFGSYLLAATPATQRLAMLVPFSMEAVWVFGLIYFRNHYSPFDVWSIADVWTRYTLAIPASILTAIGLVAQQRAFRRAGLIRFGQDALLAAVAFGWYGLAGQMFPGASPLPPSDVVNSQLFQEWFGFPVQILRALMAILASIFVIRFLRSIQFEVDKHITELQEARLKEAQERDALRGELFRRVVAAQEAERQRIARDLHDETSQALTAIGMGLRGLSTSLHNPPANEKTITSLRHLETLSVHSLDELQRLIADLRPSHLDDLGLPAAIRWYSNIVQERTGLRIKVEIEGDEREIGGSAKIALFRIVQEALSNIVKHSGADHVDIQLAFQSDTVRVRVRDDGVGFEPDKARLSQNIRQPLGLVGMQERATLLGGQFRLDSSPGNGTVIQVVVPYTQDEDGGD
jgi:signal transduction histidine kinase